MLVDAQPVEALRLGELQLVEELMIKPAGLLGIVEMVWDVDLDRAVFPLEIVGQELVRHEVKEADFHRAFGCSK